MRFSPRSLHLCALTIDHPIKRAQFIRVKGIDQLNLTAQFFFHDGGDDFFFAMFGEQRYFFVSVVEAHGVSLTYQKFGSLAVGWDAYQQIQWEGDAQ